MTEVVIKPPYDVAETVSIEVSKAQALSTLAATELVTSATAFGNAELQPIQYPLHEARLRMKSNIEGELPYGS